MTTLTLSSRVEADIAAPAQTIYDYVATPAHWVGTHPQTVDVCASREGTDPDRVAGEGDAWIELIRFPEIDEPVGAEWRVTKATSGTKWQITTHVSDRGLDFDTYITYDLAEADGVTHFIRTMSADFPADALIPVDVAYQLTQTGTHDGYLAELRERFEV